MLLALLAAAAYLMISPLEGRAGFEEGVDRFETLLRMARAEAAGSGLRVRLAPERRPDGVRVRILLEPDPLHQPGRFTRYSCAWRTFRPTGLARLAACRLIGPEVYRRMAVERPDNEDSDGPELEPVTFYPDGSSDSATFELTPIDQDDPRRAVIRLDGINGTITTRLLSEEELDEYHQQTGPGDRWGRGT